MTNSPSTCRRESRAGVPLDPQGFVDLAVRLRASREARDASGLHAVDGVRNAMRCVEHGVGIGALGVCRERCATPAGEQLVRVVRRRGVPIVRLSREAAGGLATTARESGLVAVVRQHVHESLPEAGRDVWLCVSSVRSPGNLGTLLRSAAAVRAGGLICLGPDVDPFDPSVVRGSMGGVFGVRLFRTDAPTLGRWIARSGVLAVAADAGSRRVFDSFEYRRPCLIMLGEERSGLSDEQRALCRTRVRIPMVRGVDSLNVGVAGSLLLYASRADRGARGSR
ncbi:MAG: RNA methyltransferase [Phycisphaerales bacterium]